MGTRKNYQLVPGQAFNITLVYAAPVGTTGATGPVDLSNYTASAAFDSPSGTRLITLGEVGATGPGIYKVASNGYLRLGLDDVQVSSLQPKCYYKLFLDNNSDSTDRIVLLHGAMVFDG